MKDRLILISLILAFLLGLGYFGFMMFTNYRYISQSIETTGTVVGWEPVNVSQRNANGTYTTVVRYQTIVDFLTEQGDTFHATIGETHLAPIPSYIGTDVQIQYLQDDEDIDVRPASHNLVGTTELILLAISLFCGLMAFLLRKTLWY